MIGNRYEELAASYLEAEGYQILAKNVTFRWGEIDLVAIQSQILVFVEVRERAQCSWLKPEETLSFSKQQRLNKAIQSYLSRYRGRATQVRVDLIGFDGEQIRHFKDFFPVVL